MSDVVDLSERPRRPWPLWFAAGWTAVVVVLALTLKLQKSAVTLGYAFVSKAVEGYTLALLSLLLWRVTEWLHARRVSAARAVAIHLLLAVAGIGAWKGVHLLFFYVTIGPRFWQLIFADSWVFQALTAVTMYGALLGGTLALQAARREREREVRAAQLELAAREAELASLRAQLHPHFLFNALHSILQLIDSDPPRAREMVVRLAEVMQATLRRADLDQVPLAREIDLAAAYLDIEKIRFASRLRVDIDVDEEAGAAGVPPLLLQPLVENAVKHGIAPHPSGGSVGIAARVREGRLVVEVSDSGAGAAVGAESGGRGLDLTRRRLDGAYGSDYDLAFDRSGGRFVVRLDLPAAHA